jgi:hypothetical protein
VSSRVVSDCVVQRKTGTAGMWLEPRCEVRVEALAGKPGSAMGTRTVSDWRRGLNGDESVRGREGLSVSDRF